jgi:aminoglycoside phosphotransferase (APT) family kinase protein
LKKISPLHPFFILRGLVLQKTKWWPGPRLTGPELRRRFDLYLQRELLPRLDCPNANCTLLERRSNRLVCRVERENDSTLVARCFTRRMGKEWSREHAEVSELVRATGVDVPRLALCDTSLRTLGRYGFDVVVEEWLEGRHPEHREFTAPDSPLLKQAAQVLARLHRQTADQTGTPWSKRRAGAPFLEQYYMSRETQYLQTIEECEFLKADPAEIAHVRALFDKHRENLDPGPPYSLVHSDFQKNNLVLRSLREREKGTRATESLALIDFGAMHYGLWPRDFVPFLTGCAGSDMETLRRLLTLYTAERPEASPDYFHQAWPYLLVWHLVKKTAATIRKHQRIVDGREKSADPDFFRQRVVDRWRRVREAISAPMPL